MAELWGEPEPLPLTRWERDGDYRRRWKTFWGLLIVLLAVCVGVFRFTDGPMHVHATTTPPVQKQSLPSIKLKDTEYAPVFTGAVWGQTITQYPNGTVYITCTGPVNCALIQESIAEFYRGKGCTITPVGPYNKNGTTIGYFFTVEEME